MRTLVITEHGPPEVLKVEERPDPQPGPGEVRIRVRAAGINFADLLARMGLYQDAPKPPCVVGYEVAGEVDMVGDGVESPAVGERVLAGCRFGGYAELVAFRMKATDPQHGEMMEILAAVDRAAELTKQLLTFSRRQTVTPRVPCPVAMAPWMPSPEPVSTKP